MTGIDDVIIKVYNHNDKFYRSLMVKDYELKSLLDLIDENNGMYVVISRDCINVFIDLRTWSRVLRLFLKTIKI